jgi:quercetin dioxygenase-like cupin family protein
MRFLNIGVNAQGRSTLVGERQLEVAPREWDGVPRELADRVGHHILLRNESFPPEVSVPRRAPEDPLLLDIGLAEPHSQWMIVRFDADTDAPLHRTDTVDLFMVVSGQGELLLEDGSASLRPGDFFVLQGLVHGWRTRSTDLVVSVVILPLSSVG